MSPLRLVYMDEAGVRRVRRAHICVSELGMLAQREFAAGADSKRRIQRKTIARAPISRNRGNRKKVKKGGDAVT